jgi:hypothetical protein
MRQRCLQRREWKSAFIDSGFGVTTFLVAALMRKSKTCNFDANELLCARVARWFSFQTKNPDSGIFWRTLGWKIWFYNPVHLEYFTTIGNIVWAISNFAVIWYIFSLLCYIVGTNKNLATLLWTCIQHCGRKVSKI